MELEIKRSLFIDRILDAGVLQLGQVLIDNGYSCAFFKGPSGRKVQIDMTDDDICKSEVKIHLIALGLDIDDRINLSDLFI